MPLGRLLLLPCPISDDGLDTIPPHTISALHNTLHYVVERARTARRYISSTSPPYAIDTLDIYEIDKHADMADTSTMLSWLRLGHDVGILSESGCPGIADPGARFVAAAHRHGAEVVPFVGPSSIVLAVMSSGMSGQHFAFVGYLPIKADELKDRLRDIEKAALRGQTQVWIETPYRNDKHYQLLLKRLAPDLKLCIATDICGTTQKVISKTIADWRKTSLVIGKVNTVFVLGT